MSFPKFPDFRKFSIDDKEEYLQYYDQLDAPYSDLSIDDVCMWLDYRQDLEISEIHGNALLRFTNVFDKNTLSYCLVGISNLGQVVRDIRQVTSVLSYTPKCTADIINSLQSPDITILEDTNNSDYVYNVSDLLALQGKHYKNLRKRLNLFKRTYPNIENRQFDLTISSEINLIMSAIKTWAQQESASHNDSEGWEIHAIETHLGLAGWLPVQAYGLFIEDKLVGVNIFHFPPHENWLIFNHTKYDYSYRDIPRYAFYSLFSIAQSQGIKWINSEQDLGIEGLRLLKSYFQPARRLQRYTVLLGSDAKYQ